MDIDEMVTQPPSELPKSNRRRATLGDLIRTTATMHHIDELFSSFTHFAVQRSDARVAQVWAARVNQQGQLFPELRAMAYQGTWVPEYVVVNPHVAAVAEYTLQARSSFPLQLVDTPFPPDAATLLQQHGLNLCVNALFNSNALLPPPSTNFALEQVPTPLAIALLLFFQQAPSQNVLLSVSNMFQHVLLVARNRGLLLAAPVTVRSSPTPLRPSLKQGAVQSLLELIPRRIEDPAVNPLAASVAIANEHTRRFYAMINDRRNVREICMLTQLDEKKASAVVQMLLAQHRIQFYTPAGQVVENPLLFEDR